MRKQEIHDMVDNLQLTWLLSVSHNDLNKQHFALRETERERKLFYSVDSSDMEINLIANIENQDNHKSKAGSVFDA